MFSESAKVICLSFENYLAQITRIFRDACFILVGDVHMGGGGGVITWVFPFSSVTHGATSAGAHNTYPLQLYYYKLMLINIIFSVAEIIQQYVYNFVTIQVPFLQLSFPTPSPRHHHQRQ